MFFLLTLAVLCGAGRMRAAELLTGGEVTARRVARKQRAQTCMFEVMLELLRSSGRKSEPRFEGYRLLQKHPYLYNDSAVGALLNGDCEPLFSKIEACCDGPSASLSADVPCWFEYVVVFLGICCDTLRLLPAAHHAGLSSAKMARLRRHVVVFLGDMERHTKRWTALFERLKGRGIHFSMAARFESVRRFYAAEVKRLGAGDGLGDCQQRSNDIFSALWRAAFTDSSIAFTTYYTHVGKWSVSTQLQALEDSILGHPEGWREGLDSYARGVGAFEVWAFKVLARKRRRWRMGATAGGSGDGVPEAETGGVDLGDDTGGDIEGESKEGQPSKSSRADTNFLPVTDEDWDAHCLADH